jgi:hypothetical protein
VLIFQGSAPTQEVQFQLPGDPSEQSLFRRGDANSDSHLSLADVFSILRFQYLGTPISCQDAADVDDNGVIDQTDALFLFNAIFRRTRVPPEPFLEPGRDQTPDRLGCEQRQVLVGGGAALQPGPVVVDCGDPNAGADLEFIHTLGRVFVSPGQQAARVPVFFSSIQGNVEGLTLSLYAPPSAISLNRIDFRAALIGGFLATRGWSNNFLTMRSEGYIAGTVAFSSSSPFETLPTLPPPGETIAFIEFSVPADAEVGSQTLIEFRSTPAADGLPPIHNEISRQGASEPHGACGVTVEIVSGDELFLRGDANRNWRLEVGDPVAVLQQLFGRSTTVPCTDAADFDDSGFLSITDAIGILRFLFLGEAAPSPPYPAPGLDTPVIDGLGCVG